MSSKENLFISNVSRDRGSPHPIEEMKLNLVSILESYGFEYEEGPEMQPKYSN